MKLQARPAVAEQPNRKRDSQRAPEGDESSPGTAKTTEEGMPVGRRGFLNMCAAAAMGVAVSAPARAEEQEETSRHLWSMGIDVGKCLGCGRCVAACRAENDVPEDYYRTWVERYVITHDGHVSVDSPSGGEFGFPEQFDPTEVRKAFHVPKLCNQCAESACTQVCPVGATFSSPEGVTLVDRAYCVGCSYCVQACPYGCRFINPELHVADKCTFCYHRITRGMRPACVEACPTGARIFGDLLELDMDPSQRLYPEFVELLSNNSIQTLKPHLGTEPKVFYANLDREVS